MQDHAFQRIKSRTIRITKRVQTLLIFMNIPNKVENEDRYCLMTFRNQFLATCLNLEADLHNSVQSIPQSETLVTI